MNATQITAAIVLVFLNFTSVFAAVFIIRYMDGVRRRKAAQEIINHIEEKISTEMKFFDIAQNYEKDDN